MSGPLSNPYMFKSAAGAGGFYTYQIANSCRFDGSTSQLDRTPSSAGNRRTFTFSTWIKKVKNGVQQCFFSAGSGTYSDFEFDSSDRLSGHLVNGGTSFQSTALFRDTSAWYHFVVIMDTTQSTADNRCKVYINGERITAWNTDPASTISQNYDWDFNNNVKHAIGYEHTGRRYFAGYLADTYMVDGTAKAIGDCGTTKNGVWIPDDPSGFTFGTNGFLVDYALSSDLGNDVSGNNNDFSASAGLSAHDQMLDTPTFNSSSNGGNFMTYNGAWVGANNTLSEGNLKSTGSSGGNTSGTFGMLTGKWYWECRAETVNAYGPTFGIGQSGIGNTDGQYYVITWQTSAGQMYGGGGDPVGMGTITVTSTGVSSLSSGDILSFWLDCDNRKLWIGKNGTIPNSGDPANGTNPQASWATTPTDRYFTATCQNVGSGAGVLNAGQNPSFNGAITAGTNTDKNGYGLFKYDPSGTDFVACCAANLPTNTLISPAETDDNFPQKLFTALAYSGDGGGSQTTGFQPDWVWVKTRNTGQGHGLFDSTRGTSKVLNSDSTNAENTSSGLTAFNTDGYTMGLYYNQSGNTYVSWSWRANGGTTSSNSNGSITSTVQVDPSGCFSIVTYTGQSASRTVGHGLSTAPDFIIVKSRDNTRNWAVYYGDTGKAAQLNNYNAADTGSYWNSTAPTSSVFSVADVSETGKSENYVAYCFANCEGYIKSGTYVGNGSTDGAFVYTGLRPAWIMCKRVDSSSFGNWRIMDNARDPNNVGDKSSLPNSSSAEESGSSNYVDLLSNGFKLRNTQNWNSSGGTYIYLAMAHNPFKYATAR